MGYRHTKQEILDGALAAAFDDGLSQLTFGRVAKRLGINDRTVVYYFPTKEDLLTEVVTSMGLQLQQTLGEAFASPAADHLELARAAWPVLARDETDRIFALFFEANGLAATGRAPFDTLVPQLVEAWIAWLMLFLTGSERATAGRGRSGDRPHRRPDPAAPARRPCCGESCCSTTRRQLSLGGRSPAHTIGRS